MMIFLLLAQFGLGFSWAWSSTELTQDPVSEVQVVEKIEKFEKGMKQGEFPLGVQKNFCEPRTSSLFSSSEGSTFFKKRLLTVLNQLENKIQQPITPLAMFKLMSFIETHQKSWENHSETLPVPYFLPSKDGKKILVQIDLDGNQNVVLAFPNNQVGKGSYNSVSRVFSYRTWERLAKAVPHDDSIAQTDEFKHGLEMYRKIAEIPKKDRSGIVDVISVKGNAVYQRLYHTDLLEALITQDPNLKLSEDQRLEIVKKMNQGVLTFHKQGWIHADLKPDNIFLNYPDSATHKELEVGIGDPGFTYPIQDHIEEGPQRRGSPGYISPHVFIQSERKTPEEKLHALKSVDGYANALTAYTTLYLKHHPCFDGVRVNIFKLTGCLDTVWRDEVNQPSFDPKRLAIQEALHSQVQKQISVQTFADAFEALPPPGSLKGGAHVSREEINRALKGFPGLAPTAENHQIVEALSSQPEGTYALFPMRNPSGSEEAYGIGIAFKTKGYGVAQKILEIPPHQKEELEKTLKFLKILGSINHPLQRSSDESR